MIEECIVCGKKTLECTCQGDYRESYQLNHNYWNKVVIDKRFTHLGAKLEPLDDFGGIDPPAERLEPKYINVKGRKEHEAIIKDAEKCKDLGLDQMFEVMVYLNRWGDWLK